MAVSLAIVVIPGARKLSGSTSTCGKNIAVQSNIAPQILLILTSVFAGELLANAREDQKHEQSPKHSAWSEAYERIRSGLLLSFELRQRELASICVQMPPNKALETHIDGPCALRKFAYGPQPAELGYTCECGAILTSKMNSAGKPNTLKYHKTLAFHQAFLDSKDSECSECKLLVDQSVGIARHLASPCHKFLKNLSDEERVRFLTSSLGLGTILRVCHIYQAPKETVKVDCPECGLAFWKQLLWEHQVNNHFGTVCFSPHMRSQVRG